MNLHEIFFEFIPDISYIFRLGYIPSQSDFHELTEEQYEVYQKQSGDMSKPVYSIVPSDDKSLEQSGNISIVKEEEMFRAGMAVMFLSLYAQESGCESEESEDILRFAAERLPRSITAGTKYERQTPKDLAPGESHLSEKEEWVEFLASIMGLGSTFRHGRHK